VAVRTCPYSLTKIPAATVVVHSYDLVCPGCGRALEISRVSRNLAVFIGLIAGVAGGYLGYYGALEHHHSIDSCCRSRTPSSFMGWPQRLC